MKKTVLMLLAASVFVFSGCTKTGPPGPQGIQGVPGPQGNANVNGSDPFTVSSWSKNGNMYFADFSSNNITTDIVDHGMVAVYKSYSTSAGPEWSPLPDINGKTSTVFNFYDNGFSIYIQNADGTDPGFPGTITFRMVAVSPAFRQAYPNNDYKNFKETVKAIAAFNATNDVVNNAAQ
jgi:hypothetical protein